MGARDHDQDSGAVYLVYGPADGGVRGSKAGVKWVGESAGDGAGSSRGAAGDVDGDGHGDIVVGAKFRDDLAGGACLILGF